MENEPVRAHWAVWGKVILGGSACVSESSELVPMFDWGSGWRGGV